MVYVQYLIFDVKIFVYRVEWLINNQVYRFQVIHCRMSFILCENKTFKYRIDNSKMSKFRYGMFKYKRSITIAMNN